VSILDDPVDESLRGHHAHLARGRGRVVAYPDRVATFCAVPAGPAPGDWSGRYGFSRSDRTAQ
jgi:hypothetical protein